MENPISRATGKTIIASRSGKLESNTDARTIVRHAEHANACNGARKASTRARRTFMPHRRRGVEVVPPRKQLRSLSYAEVRVGLGGGALQINEAARPDHQHFPITQKACSESVCPTGR